MRIRVATLAELPDRTALKFPFQRGGSAMTGILANHDGQVVAYVNRCRHVPFPLDWDDGRFYSRDREYFICHTHGAVYEPRTGVCVMGPCAGDALEALTVVVENGEIWVEL